MEETNTELRNWNVSRKFHSRLVQAFKYTVRKKSCPFIFLKLGLCAMRERELLYSKLKTCLLRKFEGYHEKTDQLTQDFSYLS